MTKKPRNHIDDLRGASRLAIEATRSVTELVEAMHRTIASGPAVLGSPLEGPARLVTGLVYGGIRGVTKLVGAGVDLALAQLAPLLGEGVPGVEREAVQAALNGVLGDYLAETQNPLAIPMELVGSGGGRVVVLVHGSCMSASQWNWHGHDHGASLARDLGVAPVYVRYNSGLHISTNGRELAALLEKLDADELVIVAHSMGGLVARAACHIAEEAGHAWRGKLKKLICLGTPHHGAPLERGGSWVDVLLGVSRYSAPLARLGKIRSAGVTDMRYGLVLDEHWQGRDRFAHAPDPRTRLRLPDGVECAAIAGTRSASAGENLSSDGMVPVASALGRHKNPELTLEFAQHFVAYGTGHLDLLDRAEVYEKIRSWLE